MLNFYGILLPFADNKGRHVRQGLGSFIILALFLVSMLVGANSALATDTVTTVTTTTDTDKKAERRARAAKAEAIRNAAKEKAKSRIGYSDTYDIFVGGQNSSADFYELSRQIERLAALMRVFSQSMKTGAEPGMAGLVVTGTPAYGPEGPNAKSVRLILDYRLMVAGNPRLKVGRVEDGKDRVRAEVVTADGSLVEEYSIDKITGIWSPAR